MHSGSTAVMIAADKVREYEFKFNEALSKIIRCSEIALTQGALSKRNALNEIIEIAKNAFIEIARST